MDGPRWTLSIDQDAYDILVGLAARLDCSKELTFGVGLALLKASLDARDGGLSVGAIDPESGDNEVKIDFGKLLRRGAYRDRDSWGPTGPGA